MVFGRGSRSGEAAELRRLLQPRPQFTVHTSKLQIAAALWDYGEDAMSERALSMTDDEQHKINTIKAWFEDPSYPLPITGQRITHHHVSAFAAITLYEGRVRELAQTRRRPQKDRPAIFQGNLSDG